MKEILTERPNLFEPNVYISFYVKLKGTISITELKNAINSAYNANETASSKVVLNNDGSVYYQRLPSNRCKIEIQYKDWQEIMKENVKFPFAIQDGELIRSFIIPEKNDISLFIMAHHLVGDGKSIVYFIEDIMNALDGVTLDFKPATLITHDFLKSIKKLPFSVKFFSNFYNYIWKFKKQIFTWENYYQLHYEYWRNHHSYIIYKLFSKEETTSIIEQAKKAKVSVNTYIASAFLDANKKSCTLGIPLSVREKDNKSMSNSTSGISMNHIYSTSHTFIESTNIIHQKLSRALFEHKWFVLQFIASLPPMMVDAVLLTTYGYYKSFFIKKLAKKMGYIGNKKRDIGISNLTILDIPIHYGKYSIEELIFVPPAISYSQNIIGVSTINNKMSITYHAMKQEHSERQTFFERGIKTLELKIN